MIAVAVVLLGALVLFTVPTGDLTVARRKMDTVNALSFVAAVENFHSEYGELPNVDRRWLEMEGPSARRLLSILLASETDSFGRQNLRGINFLSVPERRSGGGGIVYRSAEDDSPIEMVDSYDQPFRVALNPEESEVLVFRYNGENVTLRGKLIAVWALGKDGIEGTDDDVRSWER